MHLKKYCAPIFVLSIGLLSQLGFGSADAIAQIVQTNQGPEWTSDRRAEFYTQDQGSRIMPLAWMRALKQANGDGFLADGLSRYGYLPNPGSAMPDVPVGFTVAQSPGGASIGMTCSACHTRQIEVNGTAYRIDGGPAIVDFQSFLADLDVAVGAAVRDDESFDVFAVQVLGRGATDAQKAMLRREVEAWHLRFHTLVERSLPDPAWGPSRLDAVSMIFNRLTGLDIGEDPTRMIPDNIALADAPTRYPFLWNAARQDKTQWPGFADNGNDILGLARNLGEVYGVFADFHPIKQDGWFMNRDYLSVNSANFAGLGKLEDLIWKIGPPQWPWQLDGTLVEQGRQIFDRDTAQGGCVECHGIRTGAFRSPLHRTWATPIQDVGTDARECQILERRVDTGVMEGARIRGIVSPIEATDTAFNVLGASVIGAIIQHSLSFGSAGALTATATATQQPELPPELDYLRGAFQEPEAPVSAPLTSVMGVEPSGCRYEARVMQGIWAAAPYLHNGSVPTLAELLKPSEERVESFEIGPEYDIVAVGLAVDQTRFDYTLQTTGCDDIASGNSRCGHEYGTTLSESEKAALLEYLKSL